MYEHNRDKTPRVVEREEFMRDPGAVVQRAKADGPIAVTDRGETMLHICIPTDVRPERIA